MVRLCRRAIEWMKREGGITLLESVVALSILGVVSAAFLNGLTTASKSVYISDEYTTAESLAQSQMEWAKDLPYVENATGYAPAPLPGGGDYLEYSVNITAVPLHDPDDGIQKITVRIKHFDKTSIILEGYKGQR